MKEITITLSKASQLKEAVEKNIDADNLLIERMNVVPKLQETTNKLAIKTIEERIDVASTFLIELYLILQSVNLKKLPKSKDECNAYYIKYLSELQRNLKHLRKLNTSVNKGFEVATLSFKIIDERIREMEKEVNTVKDKISNFNQQFKLTLNVNEVLIPLLESIGIK